MQCSCWVSKLEKCGKKPRYRIPSAPLDDLYVCAECQDKYGYAGVAIIPGAIVLEKLLSHKREKRAVLKLREAHDLGAYLGGNVGNVLSSLKAASKRPVALFIDGVMFDLVIR